MTTPLPLTAAARDAAPAADVVCLASYRARRRPIAPADDADAPLAAAAGGAFTLDRFLERARLVLLEGGGAGATPEGPRRAPLRLA